MLKTSSHSEQGILVGRIPRTSWEQAQKVCMRPKQLWARPKGLLSVSSIITGSCSCCSNQRLFGSWPQGPWNWIPSFWPGWSSQCVAPTSLFTWTSVPDTHSRHAPSPAEKWRGFSQMPPDVKLQGLFPGFQPLKRVLLQGGGKCCVVNKGFSRKSLHLPPAVSSPSFLAPNHHQHWIQLEKLGMVGTFTQISLLFFF